MNNNTNFSFSTSQSLPHSGRFFVLFCWILLLQSCVEPTLKPIIIIDSSLNIHSIEISSNVTEGIRPLQVEFKAHLNGNPEGAEESGKKGKFVWDFGDSKIIETTKPETSHVYEQSGKFSASVTWQKDQGTTLTSAPLELTIIRPGQGELTLGSPQYSGSGCPDESIALAFSPQKKSISFLFDQFLLEVQESDDYPNVIRKSCHIVIPLHVPDGMSVSLFRFDYRGFASLPEGSKLKVESHYALGDQRGPASLLSLQGEYENNFILTQNISQKTPWSPCGKDLNLSLETHLHLELNEDQDFALASLDSLDGTSGMSYFIQTTSCQNQE